MIFRIADRKAARHDRASARVDELLTAVTDTFGRHPDRIDGDRIEFDGVVLQHAPADLGGPAFVVVPECDRCATTDVDQFPLEDWTMFGVQVRGQSRATCRDCRFLSADVVAGSARTARAS